MAVVTGEQLSEFQLLQGLLLPSASNFAEMLATWDLGGVPAFVARMNARAAALGMSGSHYADVCGFSPLSVSIPSDLIKLGQTAMLNPVFAQIVAQPQATLPVAGIVHNLDTLLGQGGVVGIKTGHTDQAGGCFVAAADLTIDGIAVRAYGAVLGQPNALAGAFAATSALLPALVSALHAHTVVRRDDVIARYRAPWDESGSIVASQSVTWLLLDGTVVARQVKLDDLRAPLPAGTRVGTLRLMAGAPPRPGAPVAAPALQGPDAGWRLTRGL